MGIIYKAVTHSVLLYSSEIWVVTGKMIKVLEGFHHRAERQITDITETRGLGGEWEYPSVDVAIEATILHPIGEYIKRRQETLAEQVACQSIYELCVDAERMPGKIRMVIWWEQELVPEPED